MLSFRIAGAFVFAALLIGCAPAASEQTSSTESAVTVCAADAGAALSQGIDVSHYSGDIDWTQVEDAGVDFAFAKATEGTTFVDPTFATN